MTQGWPPPPAHHLLVSSTAQQGHPAKRRGPSGAQPQLGVPEKPRLGSRVQFEDVKLSLVPEVSFQELGQESQPLDPLTSLQSIRAAKSLGLPGTRHPLDLGQPRDLACSPGSGRAQARPHQHRTWPSLRGRPVHSLKPAH